MKNFLGKNPVMIVGLLVSASALSGCMGGTTYGTGVSQETQLLNDVSGIVALGGPSRKEAIDYTSRPKLVKAPKDGTLPPPAESTQGDSAYFPQNPEERRAAANASRNASNRRIELDGAETQYDGSSVAGHADAGRRENVIGQPSAIPGDIGGDRQATPGQLAEQSAKGSKERLARMREINGVGLGAGPRKYLTEPPIEYRTPAANAAQGQVGQREYGSKERQPLIKALETKS